MMLNFFNTLTHIVATRGVKPSLSWCAAVCTSLCLAVWPAQPLQAKPAEKAQTKKSVKSAGAHKQGVKPVLKASAGKKLKATASRQGKASKRAKKVKFIAPPPPSVGMLSGLHATPDPLALKSGVALVVDASTGQVLLEKNAATALPIASITKLMAALVVVDANQDLNEMLTIGEADVQLEHRVRSRLSQGTQMTRREALALALMASENRAANMLTRYYAGGKSAFVDAMNRKAAQLGMSHSQFVEGTGLASANVASAYDLVKLVKAAHQHPLLRELSTQANYTLVDPSGRVTNFHTTNRLIANPNWNIGLQKTGFINAAGQCLVMSTQLDGRAVIMVFLDSVGELSRLGDAQRVRDWLATQSLAATGQPAQPNLAPVRVSKGVESPVSPALAVVKPIQNNPHAQQMIAWSPK